MKNIILLVIISFLISCKSKTDFLTERPWHLFQKVTDNNFEKYHKPNSEVLVFDFKEDGTFTLKNGTDNSIKNRNWRWKDDKHKYIVIYSENGDLTEFHVVGDLTSDKLSLSVFDDDTYKSVLFILKHNDDKEWLKMDIDSYNDLMSKSKK